MAKFCGKILVACVMMNLQMSTKVYRSNPHLTLYSVNEFCLENVFVVQLYLLLASVQQLFLEYFSINLSSKVQRDPLTTTLHFFWMKKRPNCQNLYLTLERMSQHEKLGDFTEVNDWRIFVRSVIVLSYKPVYGSCCFLTIDTVFKVVDIVASQGKELSVHIHEDKLCKSLGSSDKTTVGQRRCISDLRKANCPDSLYRQGRREVFSRSIAPYQVPGDVLICSGSKTTAGRASALGVTTWFKLMIIHCPSPHYICFLH